PEAKLFATIGPSGQYETRSVADGATRPIRGMLPGDDLIQWSSDGGFLFVRALNESEIDFYRVNVTTGQRTLWKKMDQVDPTGMIGIQPGTVHMTPDGRSFVYSYWQVLTDLYLVDGLK